MKLKKVLGVGFSAVIVISIGIIILGNRYFEKQEKRSIDSNIITSIIDIHGKTYLNALETSVSEAEQRMAIVYDGMTIDELAAKLDRYLKDDLSGKGYLYATHSLKLGVDPYLSVAISMHETGCQWGCSKLLKNCNNVGGQKGQPNCQGTYKGYDTLDDGIRGFIDNIYNNYYKYGLTTPDEMNPKYAADPKWSYYVNKYIEQIKSV